jgi:hypothetical protein
LKIPLYLHLPKFYTCPCFTFKEFKVGFEINIGVKFEDGTRIAQNIPLRLFRQS